MKERVLDLLAKRDATVESHTRTATDEQILNAIVGEAVSIEEHDAIADSDSTTSADYDYWVLGALQARKEGRIEILRDGTIEHPTAKVLRLGIESIHEGKPSEVFLTILEALAKDAEAFDLLHEAFPRVFRKAINARQIDAAKKRAHIVEEFRRFCRDKTVAGWSFSKIKKQFKIVMTTRGTGIEPKEVDRALDRVDLNFSAKPGPEAMPRRFAKGDDFQEYEL